MKSIIIFLIKTYQRMPKLRPAVCRFVPSCSDYAIQAVQKYGAFRGSILSVIRVSKCHPYHPGGLDPVK